MVNETLEELQGSFRWRDDQIFTRIRDAIKSGVQLNIVDLFNVGNRIEIKRSPEVISGNSYFIFGDGPETDTVDGIELVPINCPDNHEFIPVARAERIMEMEFIMEDSVLPLNNVERGMDRFYNYIRTLR